jgi:hypothetical protein
LLNAFFTAFSATFCTSKSAKLLETTTPAPSFASPCSSLVIAET